MKIWVVSDTHFGHENIIKYCNRPFANAKEMDAFMVEAWNRVVNPRDHVYHLGDVAMRRQDLQIVKQLHGHKRLVLGNHDIFSWKDYVNAGFEKLFAVRVFSGRTPKVLLTHIPIHPESLGGNVNLHGHIHNNCPEFGPQYLNLSVEVTNYAPVELEDAISRAQQKMSQATV